MYPDTDNGLLEAIQDLFGERAFTAELIHHTERCDFNSQHTFSYGNKISKALGGDPLFRTPGSIRMTLNNLTSKSYNGRRITRAGMDGERQMWKIEQC